MTDEENKLFGIEKLNVPRSDIPAVTHVDYSARIQTVHERTNPRYHALISSAFERRTGCPVLVNTSFNVRGEPIVGSARGRVPLLHGHRAGHPGRGQLPVAQGAAEPGAQAELRDGVRTGLTRAGA
jgi:hypothetical protein